MTVRANELRGGDKLSIDGQTRTVESVYSGRSETRVVLAGNAFPSSFILWNGDPCEVLA
jgi:hypothetical protein